VQLRKSLALSHCLPATKSSSWTVCGSSFYDTNISVILTNNLDTSGNELLTSSASEIDELCNQVFSAVSLCVTSY